MKTAGSDLLICWKSGNCAAKCPQPQEPPGRGGVYLIPFNCGKISTKPARVGNTSLPNAVSVKGISPTSNTVNGHLDGGYELRRRGFLRDSFMTCTRFRVLKWISNSRSPLQYVDKVKREFTVVIQLLLGQGVPKESCFSPGSSIANRVMSSSVKRNVHNPRVQPFARRRADRFRNIRKQEMNVLSSSTS
jgi:hypothetical protein